MDVSLSLYNAIDPLAIPIAYKSEHQKASGDYREQSVKNEATGSGFDLLLQNQVRLSISWPGTFTFML